MDLSKKNTVELNPIEHQLVVKLVTKFARSVDISERVFEPDSTAYPVMFDIAKGVLSALGIDYASIPAKAA